MIEIVKAQEKHLDAIVEIWKEFMDYHKLLHPLFSREADSHLKFRDFVVDLISRADALVLAALDDDKVIGYTLLVIEAYPPVFTEKKFGHLYDMAVTEEYRRKGVGEMMMKKAEEWCREKELKRMELLVLSENPIGYNFWRKQGFGEYMKKMAKLL